MGYTADYALRLVAWACVAAAALGGPVWLCWRITRWWADARQLGAGSTRADLHLFVLAVLPLLVAGAAHWTLVSLGGEIVREPLRGALPLVTPSSGGPAMLVAIFWVAGAIIALARIPYDLAALSRRPVAPAPDALVREVTVLAERVGWKGSLRVCRALVPSPFVFGWRRPTLAVPPAVARFQPAEREALLLHEIAHIARRDFAANLLHRVLAAGLWFQPAARVLLRQIALERETRCDAAAVIHGASPTALARALVRLAERGPTPRTAMAASGARDLEHRLKLLAADRSQRQAGARLPLWSAAIATMVVAALAGVEVARRDGRALDLYIASAVGPVVAISATDPAGSFALKVRGGRVLTAQVMGHQLPPTAVRQRGTAVTLLRSDGRVAVRFALSPAGRISWHPRRAATSSS